MLVRPKRAARGCVTAALAALSFALPGTASATPPPSASSAMPTPVDALGDDVLAAFRGPNAVFYSGAVVATWSMAFGGVDHAIRVGVQRNLAAPAYGDAALYAGYVLPLVIAPTVYVIGLATRDRTQTGAGSAALQALAVTFVTTSFLKVALGRDYPLHGGDPQAPDRLDHPEYARDFHPFQRLNLPSLPAWPSGHTSSFISVAASLTAYYPEKLWIPLVGYPVAVAIGFGMIDGDRHWASDVVAGALIGHAIGYSIGKSFRSRIADKNRVGVQSLRIAPLAGATIGASAIGVW
jgi:membrane-associated phospholipid phosphatase